MTVVDNGTAPPAAHSGSGSVSERKQNWFQKNKKLALGGGAAIAFLLLSHKGSNTGQSSDASTVASDAAAEQAAIDQAVGANQAANGLAAGSAASGGGGDSGSGDTSPTDTVASSAGPGPDAPPPPVTVINEGSPQITINSPGTGLTTNQPSRTITAPVNGQATPAQNKAINAAASASAREAAAYIAAAERAGAKPGPAAKGKPTGAALFISGQAPAPPKPKPKTKPKTHTKGSVMKYGRAFPGAQSVHVGRGHTTSDGVLHEAVTVNYGGFSETHMSHNRGQAWTDNVPGYSPPSRGVPLERLGTA